MYLYSFILFKSCELFDPSKPFYPFDPIEPFDPFEPFSFQIFLDFHAFKTFARAYSLKTFKLFFSTFDVTFESTLFLSSSKASFFSRKSWNSQKCQFWEDIFSFVTQAYKLIKHITSWFFGVLKPNFFNFYRKRLWNYDG